METCERCRNGLCASKVNIFSNLDTEELLDIIKMTGQKSYSKGETIFLEQTEANTLYIVNEGKIKLFKETKDGKEQILYFLSEGDFFGELNLLAAGKYSFNAMAVTDSKLCTLSKDKMRELILAKPEIALKILEVVGERLAKVETLAQNLATNDVEARIAYLLLDLAERYGEEFPNGIEIIMPLNREEMSNYTGVARETISRKLRKFEEQGIIKLYGTKKIVVLNVQELENLI